MGKYLKFKEKVYTEDIVKAMSLESLGQLVTEVHNEIFVIFEKQKGLREAHKTFGAREWENMARMDHAVASLSLNLVWIRGILSWRQHMKKKDITQHNYFFRKAYGMSHTEEELKDMDDKAEELKNKKECKGT